MKNIINIPDSVSLLSSDRKSEYSFIEIRIFAEEPYCIFRQMRVLPQLSVFYFRWIYFCDKMLVSNKGGK